MTTSAAQKSESVLRLSYGNRENAIKRLKSDIFKYRSANQTPKVLNRIEVMEGALYLLETRILPQR